MLDDILRLQATALPLAGSPGPATLSIAAMGAAYGVRASLPYCLGIVFGTMLVLIAVASGLAGMLLAVPGLVPVVTVIALGYILYLAVRIATAPPLSRPREPGSRPAVGGALILALSNPKAYAALGAVCSSVVVMPANPTQDALIKVASLSALILVIDIVWLGFGATFSSALGSPRIARVVNVTFAVLLVASVFAALVL
ncbi:LysE family translocator [Roseospira marina]|nr:LysE family translocator [Roseospira marina]MBB4315646.1 threonine/homoserine/homoserine lactone efflux protein [Roseospira marina]MBB5088704.1 threonine/homoserine/homoserine lactone efflux protein [Roseospira marina]